MIKKGQTKGEYKGVPYEVTRLEGHKDRWFWIVGGVSSLPQYASGKKYALFAAHEQIDRQLVTSNKPVVLLTWEQVYEEMSIAGQRDQAIRFGQTVLQLAAESMDLRNIPSIDNTIFSLERVIQELKQMMDKEQDRQHPG